MRCWTRSPTPTSSATCGASEVRRAPRALLLFAAAGALGCALGYHVADPVAPELRAGGLRYFVANHGQDERRIDQLIARELASRGFQVSSGFADERPERIDVLVVYEDRWFWDMGTYLLYLRIDFRDPESNVLLAKGVSYQTSLARKPTSDVVRRVVDDLLAASGG